ncbi:hypothetical protein G7046_g4404 [Stylonectria norvegica]|nr:hypothetical protein G7046_g4404 [Stylonectria norvegica]
MSTTARMSWPAEAPRRTNSLGFAKTDCHTCAKLHEKCDRKRPQCGACLFNRRKCGGFAMNLMWKAPVVQHQPSSKPSQQRRASDDHLFKFVRGRASRRRQPKPSRGQSITSDEAPQPSDSCTEWQMKRHDELDGPASNHPSPRISPSPVSSTSWSSAAWSNGNNVEDLLIGSTRNMADPVAVSHDSDVSQAAAAATPEPVDYGTDLSIPLPLFDFFLDIPTSSTLPEPGVEPIADDVPREPLAVAVDSKPQMFEFSDLMPLQVTYQNLAHKYQPVLALYNQQFCVMPISHDCPNNPFRMRMDFTESFTFLLHAILAISSHHLAKTSNCSSLIEEMQKHWGTAIKLFSTALGHCNFLPLLDTLLILINIETTQSAYGIVDMHLRGAHELLLDSSAVQRCEQSPDLRAKLAMLIWWDVTASLIARREPRLPMSYLDTLAQYEDGDGWSFFALNGCPIDLVQAMYRLAKLASIYEKTAAMEWTIFNRLPVDSIADAVKNYHNYESYNLDDTAGPGPDANARRNRFHCIEAWRHAILLYVTRVFAPRLDLLSIESVDHCTRVILDSTRCIPAASTLQKQLLLPIFLAASEVGDDSSRSFVREYCRHWSKTSHFYQFETVTALLEEVWNDWEEGTRQTYWWGIKTRKENGNDERVHRGNSMPRELLLG